MVPGAEASGRLDLDDDGIGDGCRIGEVPWRRDDDPADADGRQIGLGSLRPVAVFDLGELEAQRVAVGNRAEGLRRRAAGLGAGEMGRPRPGRAEVVFLDATTTKTPLRRQE